jgi:hypothetical protein
MKCALCEQRKGKRYCPAKAGLLCAQCCGEKRVLEIACPESCEYLKSGREWEVEDYKRHMQKMGPANRDKHQKAISDYQDVIAHLEYALARERILSRDLKDRDVVRAVDVLLETYRTEEKGILYEKTSDDLRIESLRRELRAIIESFRNPKGEERAGIVDPHNGRLQLGGAVECLEFIRTLAAAYLEDNSYGSGYVDFLARVIPREKARGSIIAP